MKVLFLPDEISVSTNKTMNVYEIAREHNVSIHSAVCGGNGTCGRCRIQVISGDVNSITDKEKQLLSIEEQRKGYRLACYTNIGEQAIIRTLEQEKEIDRKSTKFAIPESCRREPTTEEAYGIGFDIGTTNVVAILWNLKTGECVDSEAMMNTQVVYGADVISRIQSSMQEEKALQQMKNMITDCLNHLTLHLTNKHNIAREKVSRVCIAGNTTMEYIVLGKDIRLLARAPFEVELKQVEKKTAMECGLQINEKAEVIILPVIGGHVGGDIVSDVIATQLLQLKGNHVLLDIGTNGEVVVKNNDKLMACSTAAGPAFEGATIQFGMRAVEGAIENIHIKSGKIIANTINQTPPTGICGSGVIQIIAELIRQGMVDSTGRILEQTEARARGVHPGLLNYLMTREEGMAVQIAQTEENQPIFITQQDIREVQLAKAAIYTGINLLMEKSGLNIEDVDSFMIAGAFGKYIDIPAILKIGLIPAVDEAKIRKVGNVAALGVSMHVVCPSLAEESNAAAAEIKHVELSMDEGFQEKYIEAINFL